MDYINLNVLKKTIAISIGSVGNWNGPYTPYDLLYVPYIISTNSIFNRNILRYNYFSIGINCAKLFPLIYKAQKPGLWENYF